eukprot:608537-Rhodomonas_salina.1
MGQKPPAFALELADALGRPHEQLLCKCSIEIRSDNVKLMELQSHPDRYRYHEPHNRSARHSCEGLVEVVALNLGEASERRAALVSIRSSELVQLLLHHVAA